MKMKRMTAKVLIAAMLAGSFSVQADAWSPGAFAQMGEGIETASPGDAETEYPLSKSTDNDAEPATGSNAEFSWEEPVEGYLMGFQAEKGTLPSGAKVSVEVVDGGDYQLSEEDQKQYPNVEIEKIAAFDICFWQNGEPIEPNSDVRVRIALDELYLDTNAYVASVKEENLSILKLDDVSDETIDFTIRENGVYHIGWLIEKKYPAFSCIRDVDGVQIDIQAEEGALPEGTEVVITPVKQSDIRDLVSAADGEELLAFDIQFLADGEEIQPLSDVKVTFTSKVIQKNAEVFHISDDHQMETVENTANEDGTAEFLAEHFSVYGVRVANNDPVAALSVSPSLGEGTMRVNLTDVKSNGELWHHTETIKYIEAKNNSLITIAMPKFIDNFNGNMEIRYSIYSNIDNSMYNRYIWSFSSLNNYNSSFIMANGMGMTQENYDIYKSFQFSMSDSVLNSDYSSGDGKGKLLIRYYIPKKIEFGEYSAFYWEKETLWEYWVYYNSGELGDKYTVTFKSDGQILDAVTVRKGSSVAAPNVPEKAGFTFMGWDVAFDNVVRDITVNAVWKNNYEQSDNQYLVTYYDWDGSIVWQGVVKHGDYVEPPAAKNNKPGYTFSGWKMTTNYVTSNMEIFPEYTIKEYLVTFFNEENNIVKQQYVKHNQSAVAPVLSRTGYSLSWNKDFTHITGNLEVKAKWTVNTYDVTLNYIDEYGTRIISTQKVNHGQNAVIPELKYGYAMSWSPSTENITKSQTLYGVYTLLKFSIQYGGLEGASNPNNPTSYDVTQTITLKDPSKKGYLFLGWVDEKGNKVVEIKKGSAGNRVFTANWIQTNNSNESNNLNKQGWISVDNKTYYKLPDGSYAKGWIKTDSGWCYFNKDGLFDKGISDRRIPLDWCYTEEKDDGWTYWYFDENSKNASRKPGSGYHVQKYNKYIEETGYGEYSCTYYSLLKLRSKGINYPFSTGTSAGNSVAGKAWYDRVGTLLPENQNITDNNPQKVSGEASMDKIVNYVLTSGKPVYNVVLSYKTEIADGHVAVIDKIYRGADGKIRILYSDIDNSNWAKDETGGREIPKLTTTVTSKIDPNNKEFWSNRLIDLDYKSWVKNVKDWTPKELLGAVILGPGAGDI